MKALLGTLFVGFFTVWAAGCSPAGEVENGSGLQNRGNQKDGTQESVVIYCNSSDLNEKLEAFKNNAPATRRSFILSLGEKEEGICSFASGRVRDDLECDRDRLASCFGPGAGGVSCSNTEVGEFCRQVNLFRPGGVGGKCPGDRDDDCRD